MEIYLTKEHETFRSQVREFAEAEIAPIATRADLDSCFPWQNVKKMAELGLFGVNVPRDLGGQGRDYLSYILTIEELARVDASHSITVSAHSTLATSPIVNFGSDAQQRRYVPLLASGRVLGGFGLTEPSAGSDAGASRTTAVPSNGGYRLNGSKIFITHAGVGEIFVVTAVTDRQKKARGITSFIVTKPTTDLEVTRSLGIGHAPELEPFMHGVKAGKKEDKMGWRASDTRELLLQDVEVPLENRLGQEGDGFINFMKTLDAGRIGVAALSLGLAQGALDSCINYTQGRRQFDRPLKDFQGIQFTLADMATEIAAARHLIYYAAWLKETARPYTQAASMAKLFASEAAMRITTRAVQLHGAHGYSTQYAVERMMRDNKICEIGEGTSEVQRMVIARSLFADRPEDPGA
ncbi:MAG: acyl-CoA dehydrogenase family protein [Longimicrobiales bacterium]